MLFSSFAKKSPLIPLFQRGIFSDATLTPLWKRGEGEIFDSSSTAVIQRTSDTTYYVAFRCGALWLNMLRTILIIANGFTMTLNNLLKSPEAYAKLAATLGGSFISKNRSLFTISCAVKSNASIARCDNSTSLSKVASINTRFRSCN